MPPRTLDAVLAETLALPFVDPLELDQETPPPAPSALRARRIRRLEARLQRYGRGRMAEDAWRRVWESDSSDNPLSGFQRAARGQLEICGEWASLIPDFEAPGREILRWRWSSLSLPPLMFTTAVAAHAGVVAPRFGVRVLDPSLRPLSRLAVLHLHRGAAHDFEDVWRGLAGAAEATALEYDPSRNRAPSLLRARPDDVPGGYWSIAKWQALLAAAMQFRAAWWLHHVEDHREPFVRASGTRIKAVCEACDGDATLAPWLRALASGLVSTDSRLPLRRLPVRRPLLAADPDVEPRVHALLWAASSTSDPAVAHLALQYLRVRAMTYRCIVADPTRLGLAEFQQNYARMARYSGNVSPSQATTEYAAAGIGLDHAEIRVTPSVWLSEAKSHLAGREPLPSSGDTYAVIHFLRRHDDGNATRHADPVSERSKDVERLEQALRAQPGLLRHLRGMDVASAELSEPLWTFLPAIRRLRASTALIVVGRRDPRLPEQAG